MPAARMASPCGAAMAVTIWRNWRNSARAFSMSTCGLVATSSCCCRNSPLPRPRVEDFAAANSASGTVSAIAFVSASTRKYSSSMPKRNVPVKSATDPVPILVFSACPMLSPRDETPMH